MKSERVSIEVIEVRPEHRDVDRKAVEALADSMARIGQMQPILVYSPDDQTAILVAGRHRMEAARKLGWEEIDAFLVDGDKIDLRLREISENLHRAELTVQERAEQIAEWAELCKQKAKVRQLGAPGGSQPTEKGQRKAARELGLTEQDVRRASKIASITPEAKDEAKRAGIDDNQSKLLAVAKEEPEKQVAKVIELASRPAKPTKLAADPLNDFETKEKWLAAGMNWWNRGSKEWREEFLSRVDQPVMDQRYGNNQ